MGNFTEEEFNDRVNQIKEYVRSGDVIQTVLSQRFEIPYLGDPFTFTDPSGQSIHRPTCFFGRDDFSIVGASPEVHVRLQDDDVLIRPIAGTRPRGKSAKEDQFTRARITSG